MGKLYQSRPYLYQRYVVERKGIEEIAKEAGCTPMTVHNWLRKFGLIRNPRTWTR